MSRIGNAPIKIPEGVEVDVKDGTVMVKGAKGTLEQRIDDRRLDVQVGESEVTVSRNSEDKEVKSKHGMYRAIINNMVTGVSEGFKIQQELNGVGFRAKAEGQRLELTIGLSHDVIIEMPEEVQVSAETPRRASPIITFESPNKQLVGQVAAKVRSLRPPEPYKGKGIKYVNEEIRRKAGKAAGKS